jgi:hypothetical protein
MEGCVIDLSILCGPATEFWTFPINTRHKMDILETSTQAIRHPSTLAPIAPTGELPDYFQFLTPDTDEGGIEVKIICGEDEDLLKRRSSGDDEAKWSDDLKSAAGTAAEQKPDDTQLLRTGAAEEARRGAERRSAAGSGDETIEENLPRRTFCEDSTSSADYSKVVEVFEKDSAATVRPPRSNHSDG